MVEAVDKKKGKRKIVKRENLLSRGNKKNVSTMSLGWS